METSDEVSPVRAAVVGDKDKVIDWLKQCRHDSVADRTQFTNNDYKAAMHGHTDICQLIINTGAVVDKLRVGCGTAECVCNGSPVNSTATDTTLRYQQHAMFTNSTWSSV
jgi:hypothetical protein